LTSLGTFAFEELVGESADEIMMGLFDSGTAGPDPSRVTHAYQAAYSLID
jgi:hypothetical protein